MCNRIRKDFKKSWKHTECWAKKTVDHRTMQAATPIKHKAIVSSMIKRITTITTIRETDDKLIRIETKTMATIATTDRIIISEYFI